jgi:hypothetical protein
VSASCCYTSVIKHKYFASIATKYSLAYNYIHYIFWANVGHPQVNTIQYMQVTTKVCGNTKILNTKNIKLKTPYDEHDARIKYVQRFLDRPLKRDFKDFNTHFYPGHTLIILLFLFHFIFISIFIFILLLFLFHWQTILYCVGLSYWPNGSVGSSDYLLYIIVITLEDGHHEGPKHVV